MQKLMEMEKAFSALKKSSIPCAEWKLAKSAKAAAQAAKKLGFPVAIKVSSKKISHKSDVGGVKTGIKTEADAEKAFNEIYESAKKKLNVKPEGVIVQKMHEGKEVIIGLKRDPQFGPVIVFGLGGIFVEILKDVSMRIAPLSKEDCIEMIHEIKGHAVLAGARGEKPVDEESLAKILMKVSSLAIKNKKIAEMDLNPVMAGESSATVVDARIITE